MNSLTSTDPLWERCWLTSRNGAERWCVLFWWCWRLNLFGTLNQSTFHAGIVAGIAPYRQSGPRWCGRWETSVGGQSSNAITIIKVSYLVRIYAGHEPETCHSDWWVELAELVGYFRDRNCRKVNSAKLGNIGKEDFRRGHFDVIRKKTAALFKGQFAEWSCISRSRAGRGNESWIVRWNDWYCLPDKGHFDYFESPELGKPTGNDMLEGKLTLPCLSVLEPDGDDSLKQTALKIRSLEASKEEIANFVETVKRGGWTCHPHDVRVRDKGMNWSSRFGRFQPERSIDGLYRLSGIER